MRHTAAARPALPPASTAARHGAPTTGRSSLLLDTSKITPRPIAKACRTRREPNGTAT